MFISTVGSLNRYIVTIFRVTETMEDPADYEAIAQGFLEDLKDQGYGDSDHFLAVSNVVNIYENEEDAEYQLTVYAKPEYAEWLTENTEFDFQEEQL